MNRVILRILIYLGLALIVFVFWVVMYLLGTLCI